MATEALAAWIATAGVGGSLVWIWISRGGWRQVRQDRKRLRPRLVLAHVSLAVAGLGLWIAYIVTGERVLRWVCLGVLVGVASLGSTGYYVWQKRRLGRLKATPSHWDLPPAMLASRHIPAEQFFPASVVLLHGVFAVVTVVLVLLVALDVGG